MANVSQRTDLKLEKVTLEDIGHLLDETPRAFIPRKVEEYTTRQLMEYVAGYEGFQLYGYYNDEHTKVVTFICGWDGHKEGVFELGPFYVELEHRQEGYGFRQVRDFLAIMKRRRKFHKYVFSTWGNNAYAIVVLQRLGFRIVHEIEDDRIDGDFTTNMELDIEPAKK